MYDKLDPITHTWHHTDRIFLWSQNTINNIILMLPSIDSMEDECNDDGKKEAIER